LPMNATTLSENGRDKTPSALNLCRISAENSARLFREHRRRWRESGAFARGAATPSMDLTDMHTNAMFMRDPDDLVANKLVDKFCETSEDIEGQQQGDESLEIDGWEEDEEEEGREEKDKPKDQLGGMLEQLNTTMEIEEAMRKSVEEPHGNQSTGEEEGEEDEEEEEEVEASSMASSGSEEDEEDEDEFSDEAIIRRIHEAYAAAREEIAVFVRDTYMENRKNGLADRRISEVEGLRKKVTDWHRLDQDMDEAERLDAINSILGACFHSSLREPKESFSTRPPLVPLDYENGWCMFVCAVVYEACRKGRERACLKENIKALTKANHPVLATCGKREAFEDFFNGIDNDGVKVVGMRGIWDVLKSRVCRKDKELAQLPTGGDGLVITASVYSVIYLMKTAISIEWCDSTVPQDGMFYCAMTGAKLNKNDPCFACNIRTGKVVDEPRRPEGGSGDAMEEDDDDDSESAEKDETVPSRDVIDNPFLVAAKLYKSPLGGNASGDGKAPSSSIAPHALLTVMAAALQADLVIKKSVEEWLDAESSYLPENNDVTYIANALTSDAGIGKIVEWFSYLFSLTYILDVCFPPPPTRKHSST